jgi:hypothetical protein
VVASGRVGRPLGAVEGAFGAVADTTLASQGTMLSPDMSHETRGINGERPTLDRVADVLWNASKKSEATLDGSATLLRTDHNGEARQCFSIRAAKLAGACTVGSVACRILPIKVRVLSAGLRLNRHAADGE